MKHAFILSSGVWIGEGKITFSTSPEVIHFYTKWTIKTNEKKETVCDQQVEMQGISDTVFNHLIFSDVSANSFKVILENELMGTVSGKGVIDSETIAWEYRSNPEFEGFEVYELQENGDYMLHAEYSSPDQYRTIVDGRIWQKSS